jgi:hypothetical protein
MNQSHMDRRIPEDRDNIPRIDTFRNVRSIPHQIANLRSFAYQINIKHVLRPYNPERFIAVKHREAEWPVRAKAFRIVSGGIA